MNIITVTVAFNICGKVLKEYNHRETDETTIYEYKKQLSLIDYMASPQ